MFYVILYLAASYLVVAPFAVWSYVASKRTKGVRVRRFITPLVLALPVFPYAVVESQTAVALPGMMPALRAALADTGEPSAPCYIKVVSHLGDTSSVLVVLPVTAKSGQTVGTLGLVYELQFTSRGWEFRDNWSAAWSDAGSASGNVFPPYPGFWDSSQWTILGVALVFFAVAASIVFWGMFSFAASLRKGDDAESLSS